MKGCVMKGCVMKGCVVLRVGIKRFVRDRVLVRVCERMSIGCL